MTRPRRQFLKVAGLGALAIALGVKAKRVCTDPGVASRRMLNWIGNKMTLRSINPSEEMIRGVIDSYERFGFKCEFRLEDNPLLENLRGNYVFRIEGKPWPDDHWDKPMGSLV